jgi:hypothetical protein
MQITMAELGQTAPADLAGYTHLVMEMRMSSPQRLLLWAYTTHGPRGVSIIGFGQNAWLRASVPLQYFIGRDSKGNDLASAQNRRTNSSWYSVWGPFGDLHTVESIGIAMEYPLNRPSIELRNVHLATKDEGSEFLETAPVLDSFKQWALADWPRKIKSQEQLTQELAAEEKAFGSAADFGYGKYGGYKNTQARATGFFRVEKIDGRWWFVDPEGHLFLSTGTNGAPGGGAGFGGNDAGAAADRAAGFVGHDHRREGASGDGDAALAAEHQLPGNAGCVLAAVRGADRRGGQHAVHAAQERCDGAGLLCGQRAAVECAGERALRADSRRTRYGDPDEAEGVPGWKGVCAGVLREVSGDGVRRGAQVRPEPPAAGDSLRRHNV